MLTGLTSTYTHTSSVNPMASRQADKNTGTFQQQLTYLHCIQSQFQVRLLSRIMGMFDQLLFEDTG